MPRPNTTGRPSGPLAIINQLDGDFYSIGQVSEMLDIPKSTLRKWYRNADNGMKAPSKQVQRGKLTMYLYTPEDVEEVKAYREGGTANVR